jgi:ribosomal protein S18 acetylase RimI-like enzyme
VLIRALAEADLAALWPIFRDDVIAPGETYVDDETTTAELFRERWLGRGGEQWIACDGDAVLGGYTLRSNYPGRGAHVGTASYIVAATARGRGVGRALGVHSLERARAMGFAAVQFNFVVSTNTAAVRLWQELGFAIVATLPGAFRHATKGFVDAYVMVHRFA